MSTWVTRGDVAIKCSTCGRRTLERLTEDECKEYEFPPRVKYKCHPQHCGAEHVVTGDRLSGLVAQATSGETKSERTVWL